MTRKQSRTRKTPAAARPQGARAVWLAGLGAVVVTGREGDRVYRRLGAEGQALRRQAGQRLRATRQQVQRRLDRALAPLQRRVDVRAARVSAAVEQGLGRALSRLGVPSKAEVEELSRRVGALSRQLRTARR